MDSVWIILVFYCKFCAFEIILLTLHIFNFFYPEINKQNIHNNISSFQNGLNELLAQLVSLLRWRAWLKQNCFFKDRSYYNLIIPIKLWKIPYKNIDKVLFFSRKQVFCLTIWKFWRDPTILQFNIFFWNFGHVFYLAMSTKGCVQFFLLFYLDLELFAKI